MKLLALAGALLLVSPLCGQRREGESRGTPGVFDYYVLSLSWSPEHCASPAGRKDSTQCGERRFAFVVHGLWPQYEKGWPQFCAAEASLDPGLISRMLDIMPSQGLIRHEWSKHGTCSGDDARAYFETVRKAYNNIRIPQSFQNVSSYLTIEPVEIERRFLQANSSLKPEGVGVVCRGRYLQEVRICLDKKLKPRVCGRGVDDACSADKAVLRPVR